MNKQALSADDFRSATIAELLAELATSSLSTSAFARSRGVPPWKLYNALRSRGIRRGQEPRKSALVPIVLKETTPERCAPLELELAGGHRILLPADFDEQTLRRLMVTLAGC